VRSQAELGNEGKELRPKLRPLSHPSLIRGRHPWRRALRRYMAEYDERDPEVALRFLTQLRQAGADVRLDDAAELGLLASISMGD
jgi:ABC-type nitrate/sulfonate/bicarbonate transport system substrate-binding protein